MERRAEGRAVVMRAAGVTNAAARTATADAHSAIVASCMVKREVATWCRVWMVVSGSWMAIRGRGPATEGRR